MYDLTSSKLLTLWSIISRFHPYRKTSTLFEQSPYISQGPSETNSSISISALPVIWTHLCQYPCALSAYQNQSLGRNDSDQNPCRSPSNRPPLREEQATVALLAPSSWLSINYLFYIYCKTKEMISSYWRYIWSQYHRISSSGTWYSSPPSGF